jgi:hypothetical protein
MDVGLFKLQLYAATSGSTTVIARFLNKIIVPERLIYLLLHYFLEFNARTLRNILYLLL